MTTFPPAVHFMGYSTARNFTENYLFYLVDSLDLIVESYALTTGSDAVLVKKQWEDKNAVQMGKRKRSIFVVLVKYALRKAKATPGLSGTSCSVALRPRRVFSPQAECGRCELFCHDSPKALIIRSKYF